MINYHLFQRLSYFQVFKLIRHLLLIALLAGGGIYLERNGGEDMILASTILYIMAMLAALDCILLVLKLVPKILTYIYVLMKPSTQKGSAGWASMQELKKSNLLKRGRGFLLGLYLNKPVFTPLETSALIVSPSGGGKTSCFVVTNLCSNPENMVVTDLKNSLAAITANFRAKVFGHDIKIIDLSDSGEYDEKFLARYNLLQVLVNDWLDSDLHGFLLSDAFEISYILIPEADSKSTNDFFPNASRKFFVFSALYLLVTTNSVSLPQVLVLLSDMEKMIDAIKSMRGCTVLDRDIKRLADDLWTKTQDADTRQLESFREGMLQPLENFSPSSSVSRVTGDSNFSFTEMRRKKCTVYIIPDPTRPKAFKKAVELLTWSSFTETMREPRGKKIVYMLDEAGNIKLPEMPTYLSLTREYRISIVIILQELEQWAVYGGQAAIELLLSQCQWKLFMGSPESPKTCALISNTLGETTEKQVSHNLGKTILDPIQTSISEVPVKLMTVDEVRRNSGLIFIPRGQPPVFIHPIGYNNIAPMKWQVGNNPYFDKPYRGKTRLWLFNWPWL